MLLSPSAPHSEAPKPVSVTFPAGGLCFARRVKTSCAHYATQSHEGIDPTPSTLARLAGFIDAAAGPQGGDHGNQYTGGKVREKSKLAKQGGSLSDSHKAKTASRTEKLMDRKLLTATAFQVSRRSVATAFERFTRLQDAS